MEPRPPEAEEPPQPTELVLESPADPTESVAEAEPTVPVQQTPVASWVAPGLPRKRLVPGARGLIYAGVIPRTVAWFLDGFLIGLTSLVVLGVLIAVIVGSPQQGDAALSVIAWIGIAVIATVYFMGFWTGPRRATPGMRRGPVQNPMK